MRSAVALLLFTTLTSAAQADEQVKVNAEAFRPYAAGLIDRLVIGTETLAAKVSAGDLSGARRAWIAARRGWERGETFLAEYFPASDEAIDTWPDADSGFHAIEPILFEVGDAGKAGELADKLVADVKELQMNFAESKLDAQGLMNGMAGIAFEIGDAKVDGGESPFAGTSLLDMQDNMLGIEALYALSFADTVKDRDAELHARIMRRMISLASALNVASIEQLDRSQVMALSEQLAGDFQDAATRLGLKSPQLGD